MVMKASTMRGRRAAGVVPADHDCQRLDSPGSHLHVQSGSSWRALTESSNSTT